MTDGSRRDPRLADLAARDLILADWGKAILLGHSGHRWLAEVANTPESDEGHEGHRDNAHHH